jgi:hypothetical protein
VQPQSESDGPSNSTWISLATAHCPSYEGPYWLPPSTPRGPRAQHQVEVVGTEAGAARLTRNVPSGSASTITSCPRAAISAMPGAARGHSPASFQDVGCVRPWIRSAVRSRLLLSTAMTSSTTLPPPAHEVLDAPMRFSLWSKRRPRACRPHELSPRCVLDRAVCTGASLGAERDLVQLALGEDQRPTPVSSTTVRGSPRPAQCIAPLARNARPSPTAPAGGATSAVQRPEPSLGVHRAARLIGSAGADGSRLGTAAENRGQRHVVMLYLDRAVDREPAGAGNQRARAGLSSQGCGRCPRRRRRCWHSARSAPPPSPMPASSVQVAGVHQQATGCARLRISYGQ